MKTLAACFFVLTAAIPARILAQATDCNDPAATPTANAIAQEQWENQSSPVYGDATRLALDLDPKGMKVECIRRSKEERLFQGQKGAAWFQTNQGIFEVWFFPDTKAAAVAAATVTSPSAPVSLPSGPKEDFIQYENLVFHVYPGNPTLAASLQRALH